MKIRVSMKDPDVLTDAVQKAFESVEFPGLSVAEAAGVREGRAESLSEVICNRWMKYGEYITVEFDTEAGTATVIENGK